MRSRLSTGTKEAGRGVEERECDGSFFKSDGGCHPSPLWTFTFKRRKRNSSSVGTNGTRGGREGGRGVGGGAGPEEGGSTPLLIGRGPRRSRSPRSSRACLFFSIAAFVCPNIPATHRDTHSRTRGTILPEKSLWHLAEATYERK